MKDVTAHDDDRRGGILVLEEILELRETVRVVAESRISFTATNVEIREVVNCSDHIY